MKLQGLDYYAYLDSPIHHWEIRCKLIGLMSLILAFSGVHRYELMGILILLSIGLYRLSRLPRSFWLSRLRYPGYFLGGVVLFLPFTVGETPLWIVSFDLGNLAITPGLVLRQEGVFLAGLIIIRFLSILTISLVLFGTSPIVQTLAAFRSLGLPSFLTDTMLLFYRYLYDVLDRLRTMQTAMRLRGFDRRQLTRRSLHTLAMLAGTLLIRSYEQSEQVYQAMRLRGYGANTATTSVMRPTRGDLGAMIATIAIGGMILLTQITL